MFNPLAHSFEVNGPFLTGLYVLIGFIGLYLLGKGLYAFTQAADSCLLFWYTWCALPGARGVRFIYNNTYGKRKTNPELEAVIISEFPRNGPNNKNLAVFQDGKQH
uniref:Envelope protein n=1 Tax=Infectious bronchitis virus TaxID=11120 RepID=A4ZCK5_9GAMC|nr:small membrane protein [Infectious bronchitis virus]APP92723.1 envelope protein [Infectious bronchitis virus]